MPSRSVKSSGTSKTVRTVDDVFSQLELDLGPDASISESSHMIKKLTIGNDALRTQSINELYNPVSIFSPIVANAEALVKSMSNYGVILGGIQATSFFYPVCDFADAPWDFFCCNLNGADRFIIDMTQFAGVDLIEDVRASNGTRVVYFRRSLNGESQPLNIRVYISNQHPLELVLTQPSSYQQTFICPYAAVCFWPRLNKKGLYRSFESNVNQFNFPSGKTKLRIQMKKLSRTVPKKPSSHPSIYTSKDERTEIITFKNECNIDKTLFKRETTKIQNIVYAVSDKSTRYLGNVSGM